MAPQWKGSLSTEPLFLFWIVGGRVDVFLWGEPRMDTNRHKFLYGVYVRISFEWLLLLIRVNWCSFVVQILGQ